MPDAPAQPLILFDGVCKFCNGSVHFMIDRDPRATLRFAPLQSETGQSILKANNLPPDQLDSLILVEDGRCFRYSTAALRIARHLTWPWRWAYAFIILPRFLRDAVYRWIARNRYKWFGKEESCRMPTPEMRRRFVD